MQAIELTRPFRTGSTRFRALLRRLRRDPDAGAFDDIQARFAFADNVRDVTAVEIERIARDWEVRLDGPVRRRTSRLYREFLRHCLDDHCLSEGELADLDHLRRVLHLTRSDAELMHRQLAREVYARTVDEVLTDATIDDAERAFLSGLRDTLGVPDPVAENIEEMKRRQLGARDRVPPKRAGLH